MKIAIFDIDNTIVCGQSQAILLKYLYKRGYISTMYYLRLMAWFTFYKLGFVKNPSVAMQYAFDFLRDKPQTEVKRMIDDFFTGVLVRRFYSEALDLIRMHQQNGDHILLVSNAVDILVKKIASFLNISDFLCTRLKTVDGVYTGELEGVIMYSENKSAAVKKYFEEHGFSYAETWAYGDHDSDVPLLLESTHPVAVNPTGKLARIANQNNWKILHFKI